MTAKGPLLPCAIPTSLIKANTRLKQIGGRLQELREQAVEQGRNTNRIDKVIEAVVKMKQEIASLVL
jgi:hypothetical protein